MKITKIKNIITTKRNNIYTTYAQKYKWTNLSVKQTARARADVFFKLTP